MPDLLLELDGVETCYGLSQVLFGMSLKIAKGEVVTLLGRNGMGKTTTVRSIMGLTPARAGTIRFAGQDMRGRSSFRIAKLGIGLVPEGRQIFPNLTVRENLVATARGEGWTLERIYEFFPSLARRAGNMGNQLSGGEQQMLAIGRCLMGAPELIMFDEPSLGLAPLVVQNVLQTIRELNDGGMTCVVVEQNVAASLKLASKAYVMENGRIVLSGTGEGLLHDDRVRQAYLGI
ncbi:MAG TPA: ABC transporter ATP-binding protein [Pseudolabrys sp.]|nr:ABC transporter ATP-binding protein [Pseudolabrys sp.]